MLSSYEKTIKKNMGKLLPKIHFGDKLSSMEKPKSSREIISAYQQNKMTTF